MASRLLCTDIWLAGQALVEEGSKEPGKRQTAVAQENETAASQATGKPCGTAPGIGGARCAALVLGGMLQHYDAAACVDQASR